MAEITFIVGELTYVLIKPNAATMNRLEKKLAVFENVTAVIFEADLSIYDQSVSDMQADTVHRLASPLSIAIRNFQQLCESLTLSKKPIMLLLHRSHLFRKKIQSQPLRHFFPNYKGSSDYTEATDYILNQFISKDQSDQRQIYTHFVADDEDPETIQFVRVAIQDIIIQENLDHMDLRDDLLSQNIVYRRY